jgi:hypothetical protein
MSIARSLEKIVLVRVFTPYDLTFTLEHQSASGETLVGSRWRYL